MKIFYSTEVFLPHISGVTKQVDKLASYFAQQLKHQVWVITTSTTGEYVEESNENSYNVLRLKSYPNPFKKNLRISYANTKIIAKILEEYQPDIIHLQDPVFISQCLAKEAHKRNIPIISTQHSSMAFPLAYLDLPPNFNRWAQKTLTKMLANFFNKYCQLVITPSQFLKEEVEQGKVNVPIKVVSNGVDLNIFKRNQISEEFLNKYQLLDFINKPIILYVGRIDKDKNLETLMRVIPSVLKNNSTHFLLVGDGNLKDRLMREVANLALTNYVRFTGAIDAFNEDIVNFYNLASVFVMPSAIEAQNLAVMEAMACGLPIVAANSGALPELVRNTENGFLVPPYAVEAYTQALGTILANEQLQNKMGQQSRILIADHDFINTCQQLFGIYTAVYKSLSR